MGRFLSLAHNSVETKFFSFSIWMPIEFIMYFLCTIRPPNTIDTTTSCLLRALNVCVFVLFFVWNFVSIGWDPLTSPIVIIEKWKWILQVYTFRDRNNVHCMQSFDTTEWLKGVLRSWFFGAIQTFDARTTKMVYLFIGFASELIKCEACDVSWMRSALCQRPIYGTIRQRWKKKNKQTTCRARAMSSDGARESSCVNLPEPQ